MKKITSAGESATFPAASEGWHYSQTDTAAAACFCTCQATASLLENNWFEATWLPRNYIPPERFVECFISLCLNHEVVFRESLLAQLSSITCWLRVSHKVGSCVTFKGLGGPWRVVLIGVELQRQFPVSLLQVLV